MNLISLGLSLVNLQFIGLILIVSLIISPFLISIIRKKNKENLSRIICSILSSIITAVYVICCFLLASILMMFNDTGAKLYILDYVAVFGFVFLLGSIIYLPILFIFNKLALFIIHRLNKAN